MARYSRRRGPPSNQSPGTTDTPINGCTVSRYYDDGELLILGRCRAVDEGAPFAALNISVDAVLVPSSEVNEDIQFIAAPGRTLNTHSLHPVAAGEHTIALRARGTGGAGLTIPANSAELIVIQLPLWDSTDDLA